jgi:hypothetical protein
LRQGFVIDFLHHERQLPIPQIQEENMTLEEKIQEIIRAVNSGVPARRIDIKGCGNSVRRLLCGSKPGARKVEEMHANLLAFRQFELQEKTEQQLNLSLDPTLTRQQKQNIILEAVEKGIPKGRIDPKGGGKGIKRIQLGGNVSDQKLDEMYLNLLCVAGHRFQGDSISPTCSSCNPLKEKVCSLEHIISSLFDRITSLEGGIEKFQKELDQKKASNSKSPKILGVTLVRKTDVVHGKKYCRWYGLYTDNGKRYWIYIGKDVSKAKDKIHSWLLAHSKRSSP